MASHSKKTLPVALTIAGSDSSGGAGIQADLKTFAALGAHGTSVVTCVTAQNVRRVLAIQPCTPDIVARQLEAVFETSPPAAIKTGMLYSAPIILQVARFLEQLKKQPTLIIDPVLVSTSGRQLLEPRALKILTQKLFPLATLITPNIPEAEALTGRKIRTSGDMSAAATALCEHYGCAMLLKGGHLAGDSMSSDCYFEGKKERWFSALRVKKGHLLHGTGCTYSAAITAGCAQGLPLAEAVAQAKQYITAAIAQSRRVADFSVLEHNPKS